jgi:hypothetical protein
MTIYKPHLKPGASGDTAATAVLSPGMEVGQYSDDLRAFIDNLTPDPAFLYLLVIALGASEFWGPNKNGDAFPEKELIRYYPTFYEAKVYKYHINKDTNHNFGDVVFAGWNPRMKRVELVLALDRKKLPDEVKKAEEGTPVSVSMGTKVVCEFCSVCGNKARRLPDRCDHLKYHMNKVLEDGRKVYAINHKPNFFDISIVLRPAEEIAYSLKKVASDGAENVDDNQDDMPREKPVESECQDWEAFAGYEVLAKAIVPFMETMERPIPTNVIDNISRYPLEKVCCTATALGIVFKPEEWQRVALIQAGLKELADELDTEHIVAAYPDTQPIKIASFLDQDLYDENIAEQLKPYIEARSIINPMWARRLGGLTKIAATAPGYMPPPKKTYSEADVLFPIGGGYLAYRFLLGRSAREPLLIEKITRLFKRSPALAFLALGGGAKVVANLLDAGTGVAYYGVPAGLMKTSSAKNVGKAVSAWWKPTLLAMAGTHLWSAESKRRSKHQGYAPGAVSNFITEHPVISGILGSIVARKFSKGFSKASSVQDLALFIDNLGLQKTSSVSKIEAYKLGRNLESLLSHGSLPDSLLDPELFGGTAGFFDMVSTV